MGKLKTVSQIAEIIEVSPRMIRRLAKNGKIRFTRNPTNNYRMFDIVEVIDDLKKIKFLK